MEKKDKLFLVCTGLGKVHRGFESYTADLAERLSEGSHQRYGVEVLAGGRLNTSRYNAVRILNISRNNPILLRFKLSWQMLFLIEQRSFFLFLVPHILSKKPKAIYLGEYSLYCYLFKLRKLLRLKYSLVLYTGGHASPGLFDDEKDYVHHVTDIYYKDLIKRGVPEQRQFIIPHFVNTDFRVDEALMRQLKEKAKGKKIVLSVGSIDAAVKRMDLIPKVLGDLGNLIFPILLGEWTTETEAIRQSMIKEFGMDGFILNKVTRKDLGSYYLVADIFILCSKNEPFGLVFLEAMLFNTPVICHDFYASRWVLKDKAHFVDMNDRDAFKEKFIHLFPTFKKDPALNLFVTQNYTWAALKESFLNMFTHIMQ